jgi:hypothetical protein
MKGKTTKPKAPLAISAPIRVWLVVGYDGDLLRAERTRSAAVEWGITHWVGKVEGPYVLSPRKPTRKAGRRG